MTQEAIHHLASSPYVSIRHSQLRQHMSQPVCLHGVIWQSVLGRSYKLEPVAWEGKEEWPPWCEASTPGVKRPLLVWSIHSWKNWKQSAQEKPGEVTASQPETHHIYSWAPRGYDCLLLEQLLLQVKFRQHSKPLFYIYKMNLMVSWLSKGCRSLQNMVTTSLSSFIC